MKKFLCAIVLAESVAIMAFAVCAPMLVAPPASADEYTTAISVTVTPGTPQDVWVWVRPGRVHVRCFSDCGADVDAWLYAESGSLIDSDQLSDCTPFLDSISWVGHGRWYRVQLKAFNGGDSHVVVQAWAD